MLVGAVQGAAGSLGFLVQRPLGAEAGSAQLASNSAKDWPCLAPVQGEFLTNHECDLSAPFHFKKYLTRTHACCHMNATHKHTWQGTWRSTSTRTHKETRSLTHKDRERKEKHPFCPLNVVIHRVCDLRPKHSSIQCWQVGYIYGTNDGEPSSTYLNERPRQNAVFLCAISFTRTGNTQRNLSAPMLKKTIVSLCVKVLNTCEKSNSISVHKK